MVNLNIKLPNQSDQITGILGYPVFQSLGAITFLQNGGFDAGSAAQTSGVQTRMYMRFLTPVIECGADGKNLPFSFDNGASGTFLSIRYFEQFRSQAKGWEKGENAKAGGGGVVRRKIYLQPRVDLTVGKKGATIANG